MPDHTNTSTYLNDADLVRAVLAREPAAEEEFFALVWRMVNAHAHAWGIRARDAEDLAIDVVVRALERLHRFNWNRAKLATWVFIIGRNCAYDWLRRDKNDPLRQENVELQTWMEVPSNEVENREENALNSGSAKFERLDDALSQLDAEERDLLRLSVNEGQTSAEVGKALNITPGEVRVRKHRLLIRLRELLSQ